MHCIILYFVATCKRPFGPLLLNKIKIKIKYLLLVSAVPITSQVVAGSVDLSDFASASYTVQSRLSSGWFPVHSCDVFDKSALQTGTGEL